MALETCGVRRVLGVLWEVLLEVTRLGPGAGVRREPPGVCALLELLRRWPRLKGYNIQGEVED